MEAARPDARDPAQLLRDLRAEWGVDAARLLPVLLDLAAGRWRSTGELVREHGVSRRAVEGLTGSLASWLEQRDGRVRLLPEHRDAAVNAWATPPEPAGDDLERSMADLLRALPPSNRALDHVAATPATAARRARHLAETFDLAGATVLCLGDHDLTSLALAQVCPEAEIVAVDVDEAVLDHIGRTARERGWRVRALFADLRVELPPSLREGCDLVFTDPPYTPAGVQLFLHRALAALRRRDVSRVALCYGYGERHPALGLKVQAEYHALHLVAEAILPRFNRYAGAEAIGAASALYLCRPTRRTWAAVDRARPADPRIYSQGARAETSGQPALPQAIIDQVREAVAGDDRPLWVGDAWPQDLTQTGDTLPLARYLEDQRAVRGRPPHNGPLHQGTVAVDLHPDLGALLPRLLLAAAARRVVAVAPAADLSDARLADLIGIRYHVTRPAPGRPVLTADRVEDEPADRAGRTLARLLRRTAATLGAAWREALIEVLAGEGRTVTKNHARAAIASTAVGATYGPCHLSELPLERLAELRGAVEASLTAVDAPPGQPGTSPPDGG